MKAISLYTGAGGLDLGFEAAGFETAVAVEMDDDSVRTLEANRNWPILHGQIQEYTSSEILKAAHLEPEEAEILIGGPPCQPFSKSAYWANGDTKRLNDPRASTLEHYLRVLRDARPRTFLMENVPGLGYKAKDEGLRLLERTLDDINREIGTCYRATSMVLNAAEFGVPQERRRIFIVGHREGAEFVFPEATHAPTETADLFADPASQAEATAWDAIGDLEDDDDPALRVTGKWADLLPTIPEGLNYQYHTERGGGLPLFGWRTRFWSFLLKLAKPQPAWTITAQPGPATGPFHWKSRRLSPQELLRLQTFPDGYRVIGDIRAVQRQLGNAVPSALAEVLGREVRAQLLGEPLKLPPRLGVTPRRPLPPPEPTRPVPKKYRRLAGKHEEHPGTGLGPGARRRPVSDQ